MDFARLSCDYNHVQEDELFASKSIFKISGIWNIHCKFLFKIPEDKKYEYSGIYLINNMNFLNTDYINEALDTLVILCKNNNIRSIMVFKTIYDVNDKVIVHGKAEIYFENTLIDEVAMK